MHRVTRRAAVAGLVLALAAATAAQVQPLPRLRVFHRAGQTFVTWTEVGGPEVTYRFYRAAAPITSDTLDSAELVAEGIPQGTARDFLAERMARLRKEEPIPKVNFTVHRKEGPLPDGTGLFVYTPNSNRTSFYALTAVWPETGEDRRVRIGVNSQLKGVVEGIRPPGPVLLSKETEGPFVLLDFLHWATPEQASVDGHPYRFRVVRRAEEDKAVRLGLIVRLHAFGGNYSQTRWTRPGFVTLSLDDFTPAIPLPGHEHSFWFGYREHLGRCYLAGEYARGEVHCNTMECTWSWLRQMVRTYRGISKVYLPLYVAQFEFFYNRRHKDTWNRTLDLLEVVLQVDGQALQECVEGKRLAEVCPVAG